MNTYKIMKEKHQNEFNKIPIFFAFNNKQFEEGMQKLGLDAKDTDKICGIGGGGYIKKSDSALLDQMWNNHEKEFKQAITADKTGDGFIFDMFNYELANHEYSYTHDITDALRALGLSDKDILNNVNLRNGLVKACNYQKSIDN